MSIAILSIFGLLHCSVVLDLGSTAGESDADTTDENDADQPQPSDGDVVDADNDESPDSGETCSEEHLSVAGDIVEITSSPSAYPVIEWTGREYGIAWEDNRDGSSEVYFARISESGETLGSERRITTDAAQSYSPSLVWNGEEYGLAWVDERDGSPEIYFTRFSQEGERIGQETRVTTSLDSARLPSVVWADGEYGVAWEDHRDDGIEIYFARLSSEGALVREVRITMISGGSSNPSLLWTGEEYGLAWDDNQVSFDEEIFLVRIDRDGEKLIDRIRVSNTYAQSILPTLAWTGSEYLVAWNDGRDDNWEIYFARITLDGDVEEHRLSFDIADSYAPRVAWTGQTLGIVWQDNRGGYWNVYAAEVTPSGTRLTDDSLVATSFTTAEFPSVTWGGSGYGVTWNGARSGPSRVHFASLESCH